MTDLEIKYMKLARKADSRLRALEVYSHQENYRGVKQYAYARAMKDIKSWSGEGATRFSTKPPRTQQGLEAKIRDIETFLESATSTKRGITSVYQKRADTINERYGTNLTWQEMGKFYESETSKKLDAEYGSKTTVEAIGAIHDIDPKKIEQVLDKDIRVSDDDVIDEIAKNLMKAGYTRENLF